MASIGRPLASCKSMVGSFVWPTNPWACWSSATNSSQAQLQAQEQEEESRPQNSCEHPFEFAACLSIRDDNLLQSEWLAHHHAVLPLRHLIVAVDPLSTTSPLPMLSDFASLADMKIEVWKGNFHFVDGHWSKEKFQHFSPHNHSKERHHSFCLVRQRSFHARRLQRSKNVPNTSLTVITDSDQRMTCNAILDPTRQSAETAKELPLKIGAQNETIAHWFAKRPDRMPQLCQTHPQLRFSSNDNLDNSSDCHAALQTSIPASLRDKTSTGAFMSLRHTSHINALGGQEPGKSIVNLGACAQDVHVQSCHRTFRDACGKFMRFSVLDQAHPARTHHHSGSLQNWLSRPTRTAEMWEVKQRDPTSGTDQSATDWLHHFVALFGKTNAQKLAVDHHNAALKEWQEIKVRVEQHHETIPMAFEWDDPTPMPVIGNHSDCQVLPKVTGAAQRKRQLRNRQGTILHRTPLQFQLPSDCTPPHISLEAHAGHVVHKES